MTLEMWPHSVRAENYIVLAQVEGGALVPVPVDPVYTVRGAALQLPGSTFAGAVQPDGLWGTLVLPDGTRHWIEPAGARVPGAGPNDHVVYRDIDVVGSPGDCGNEFMPQGPNQPQGDDLGQPPGRIPPVPVVPPGRDHGQRPDANNDDGGIAGGTVCYTQLACDADFEFFGAHGSTVAGVTSRINLVINTMNPQYETQCGITHVITTIIVRTTAADPYTSFDSDTLLCQFLTEWTNNMGGVTRDVAKLFTGRELNGTTIGQATNFGEICDLAGFCQAPPALDDGGYCHSENDCCTTLACSTDLAAHELGHLWSATHCCAGTTMNPSITCANSFSAASIGQIVAHRNAIDDTCLQCGGSTCPGTGSCYVVHGTPGCSDSDCCETVCAVDIFCCNTSWDQICVNEALDLCGNCGDGAAGSCFVVHATPGCNDAACCAQICALDAFCCNSSWDSLCVDEAQELCAGCGAATSGSCFLVHANPGCNNADCCATVCDADPFCCDNNWDSICVDEAQELCAGCGSTTSGSCFVTHANTGCNDGDCCAMVCDIDTFCCATSWDSICVGEAQELCAGCGDPASGSCFSSHGNPGCNIGSCCSTVCNFDTFCCDNNWDSICANEAEDLCGCPADIAPPGGNGVVNVEDLLVVIGAWGACSDCPADLVPAGNNGLVNVQDLLKIISSWGPCPDFCSAPFSCGGPIVECPNGEAGCFCWEGPGGVNVCAPDFFCPPFGTPCNNGICPPGMICVTSSCCGVPTCAPICGIAIEGPPAPGQEVPVGALMSSGRTWTGETAK